MTRIGERLIFLVFLIWPLASQALLSVQASVDTNQTAVEEGITFTISVLSSEVVDIDPPRLADIEGFRLDNVWDATSVSQKLVSGSSGTKWESQRRRDFNHILTPMRPGRLTIPAVEVKVGGQVYRTQPILITVADNGGRGRGAPQKPQRQRPRGGFGMPGAPDMDDLDRLEEEMFQQLLNQRRGLPGAPGFPGTNPSGPQTEPQYRSMPGDPNDAFFVQVEVDKTEVFVGEQITVSWYLYTRGQMESLDRVKFPDLKGFWKEIIEEVPAIQFSEEIVNGVAYRKALLASHALFPIKAGTATIDEYRIKSRVRLPVQNGFGFGLGRANEYTQASKKVDIKVKALPEEGKPADFTGAVGRFEVQTSVEGQKFPANQPFNLRIRFDGTGNAKLIELPKIDWPSSVEVYDTKTESRFFKDGRSYKQFDILMIPRVQGALSLPEVSFSLFDPATKKYYQKKTAAVDLDITEGTQSPQTPMAETKNPAQKAKNPLQIPGPALSLNAASGVVTFASHPGALGGLYLLVILALLARARRELGWGQRKKTLKELVERRFKKVEAGLKSQDHKKVGAELMNVFYFLLGEISGQGGAVQELERLMEKVPPSVRRDFGDPLKKAFAVYQVLCFAPEEMARAQATPEKLKATVKEAQELSQKMLRSMSVETVEQKS